MKRKLMILIMLITFMLGTTSSVSAIYRDDPYAQKKLKLGYTVEDMLSLDAVLYLSEENVKGLILQKYDELKDWKKVCKYYDVEEKDYENYIYGKKKHQEVLDAIPDYIYDEMNARGWTKFERSDFADWVNISKINYEYAWRECKKGRAIMDIVEEKRVFDEKISELDTEFISKNMSVQEYEKRLAEILEHDIFIKTDNMIADAVAEVIELRDRTYQRHKESSGITEEEIEYCQSQGLTNPFDIYQAKYISKRNDVPFDEVVQTYLEVDHWSITVIEVLNIPPEEYIKTHEDIEDIEKIKNFYSLDNEDELKQDANQDMNQNIFDINDYIVLMVGSGHSYVYGQKKQIDEKNPDVSIFVENDRSYVPIRFLTENYGGSVEWVEETQTVNLFFDDSKISLTIGETDIHVDDEVVTSDAAPVLKNGRTFLPLRACINALEKHVFYSKGLILISESQSSFDESRDGKIIDEIIEKYFK